MSELFLTVLNMSLTASYVIIFVILVRLLLKKAPRVISYALWVVVAFRLIIPFSFESMFSLMPRNTNATPIPHDIIYQQSPKINSGIEVVDSFVSQSLPVPAAGTSANPLQIYVGIGAYIWVLGIIALLVYSLVSILILKRQLKSAQLIENNIFEAKNLKTPFVLGLIKPKIYLPVGLNATERSYILLHEQTHIHRKDHIIKVLAFLTLSIHWFNPLVWIAFMLMSKDMELSCDERVLKEMNEDIKKPYANSLLLLATERHILNSSPLAFGEGNVKGRIKNVLNYKKPRFWLIILTIIIVTAIGIGLMANPMSSPSFNGSSYRVEDILYQAPQYSFVHTLETTPQYCISSDYQLYSKGTSDEDWIMHNGLYRYNINRQELYSLFKPLFNKAHEAIDQAKLIYRTDTNDDSQTFYLVIQQKNEDVLLAVGYDSDENCHIRWLFRLEKISDSNDEVIDIYLNTDDIAKFVEDNLNVIMSSPKTSSNPQDYINAHKNEYENFFKYGGEDALQYMLTQFEAGNAEGLRGQIMMRLCKELLGARNDVADDSLSPQEWYNALDIRQEIMLPNYEYDGQDTIEKLIYDTEIERDSTSNKRGGFMIVAPKIFGSYEEEDLLKVFVTTYSARYKLFGNILSEEGGSIIPAAITYRKDDKGRYVLQEYEQARDGSEFGPSIREYCTMPVSGKEIKGLASKILSHDYEDIRTLLYENLFNHLKKNGIKDATLTNSRGEVEFTMSNPKYIPRF